MLFDHMHMKQQASQVLSLWLSILHENNDWAYDLLASDISYTTMIYDLITQILDPCSYIANQVEFIQELQNAPHSVITQVVGVYHS